MQLISKALLLLSALAAAIGLFTLAYYPALPSTYYSLAAIVPILVLAISFPKLAIGIFLFLLPVFGNKPGTLQANLLTTLGLSLHLGLSVSVLLRKSVLLQNSKLPSNQVNSYQGLIPILGYLLVSLLSLFPISMFGFWGWFRSSQTSFSDLPLIAWNTSSLLSAREDQLAYPVLSVVWTFLSFSLCLFVYHFSLIFPKARQLFCWSLFLGFIFSLLVGLLNYYNLVDLSWLRGLDPVVNPGGTQYRLQSWFGHSGWFAEYITLLAPFSMLLLTLNISFISRVSILLAILLIGEIVLILTFQRGGWLSYPLTLVAIWTSIYVLRRLEKGDNNILGALKSSITKILISIPLTILVSFLFLKIFGSQFGLEQYSERFRDITKASDRSEFIKAGFSLGALNPILGQGSESFALQYKREYKKADGAYYGGVDLPLHGSAHNLYAQTFAGKGALGLLGLLFVIYYGISSGLAFVFKSKIAQKPADQIIALSCICSLIACFIYGFVQELFYVQSLQYVFFAIVGILAGITSREQTSSFSPYAGTKRTLLLICALFVIHLFWNDIFGRQYKDSSGCYGVERINESDSWIWCGVRSSIDLPLEAGETRKINFELAPASQRANQSSALVSIESCEKVIFSRQMKPGEKAELSIESEISSCQQDRNGYVRLKAYSSHYFIPAIEDPTSADRRVLALRWLNPAF